MKILCPVCNKRMINDKILQGHLKKRHSGASVSPAVEEKPVEAVTVTPQPEVVPEKITLRFKIPVEVMINGVHYSGKVVEVNNLEIASEVVRIAREAFGNDILE